MRLSTLWRPFAAALLVTLMGSPFAAAQDATRADLQAAQSAAEAGVALTQAQKVLLGQASFATEAPLDIVEANLGYTLGYRANAGITLPDESSLVDLLTQDFAGGIPAAWTASRTGAGTNAWIAKTNAGYGGGTNQYVGWNDDATGSSSFDQNVILRTPAINTTGNATVFANFDYGYRRIDTTSLERYALEYSVDGGTTWATAVADLPSTGTTAAIYPNVVNYSTQLPAAAGNQADLRLRWRFDDGSGASAGWVWWGALDNVRIATTGGPPLAAPGCAVVAEPTNGATGLEGLLRFRATAPTTGGAPSGYKLFLGTDPAATNIADGNLFTDPNVVLSSTTPGTVYYWRFVPTNATGDATGCTTNTATTKVLPVVNTFPYVQNFDASTNSPGGDGTVVGSGILPDWYNRAGGSDFWRTEASSGTQPAFGASVDHTSGTGRMAWLDDSEAPLANNAQWWTPRLDLSSLSAPRIKFWYQNVADGATLAADGGNVAELSILNVIVSTDGGATFTNALTVDALANQWTEYVVDLTPFISTNTIVAFNVTEAGVASGTFQFRSDPSLDDVTIEQAPVNPVFAISPNSTDGPVNVGTAGVCAGTVSTTQSFTVSNSGAGTLNVTGATLAGAAAGQYSVDTSNLPAMLTAGQSADIAVTFTPTVGAAGDQAATLQVAFNNGTAQTSTVSIVGTRTAENANGGSSAGFAFANTATGACAPAGTPPLGTGFIDIATHTRITDWTDDGTTGGDDSYFEIDAATLDALIPSGIVRFMGVNNERLFVNSNGYIGFGAGTGSIIGSLPTTLGGGAVAALAMDLDVRDNDADPGQYAIGAYYGTTDVDSDGTADLVVTWYHAYDFGSPVYTDPEARYATSQVVIFRGDRANRDDRFEIRLADGNDPTGIPYRAGTTLAPGFATAIEADVSIGLTASTSTLSGAAEYRDNGVGGYMYLPGGGSNAIRFEPQTQSIANGGAGWRLMGSPVTNFTVGRLADLNLVQSITGQYPNFPSDNVYTSYNTSDGIYVAADNVTNALAPGQGFFWYLFDQNIDPTAPGPNQATDGTSKAYTLPMSLQGTGAEIAGDATRTISSGGNGFSMLANPFRSGLNVAPAAVATWTGASDLASNVFQVWNPAAGGGSGSYTTAAGDVAAAWQGFFVQANSASGATLVIPAAAKVAGGTFVGRESAPVATLGFELAGTDAETGAATVDVAARLAVSEEMATDGWDALDATKLMPLLSSYATIGFQGEGYDGEAAVKSQESRALDATSFSVPMVVDAAGTDAAMTLSWNGLDAMPATWQIELRDLVTGTVVNLRTQGTYAFEQEISAARSATAATLLGEATTGAQAKAGAAARFELVITTGRSTAGEGNAITEFALAAPAPNPTSSASMIRYDVPETSRVSVSVYDLLGRRVSILADGEVAAGRHEARLDAGSLAPGVYVVRMQSGTFAATQRVTVVR